MAEAVPRPQEKTVTRLDAVEPSVGDIFSSVADRHPLHLAIASESRVLTYRELDAAARRAGSGLIRAVSVPAPHRIAIMLNDRVDQVVAMLAVLGAGHAYVPLDARLPAERLAFLIRDCEPAALVTDDHDRARAIGGRALPMLDLDALGTATADSAFRMPVRGDALAFILYTSGSTGEPKGVMQTHRNVVYNALKYGRSLCLTPDDRVTWFSGYEFGASVPDIFGALLNGAAVLPYSIRARGLAPLARWLQEERATVYHSAPTIFRRLCQTMPEGTTLPDLRLLRLAGEPLFPGDVDLFRQRFTSRCALLNTYSMTEMYGITQARVQPDTVIAGGVPAGAPMEGITVVILTAEGGEAESGAVGEVAIRSPYLTPGYWRRPDLTAQVLVPDPQGPGRLFKTGDLGRLRANGSLEHHGRKDSQVKMRGLRIEPAEIEAALVATGMIKEAAVVARSDARGEPRLVACVVWAAAPVDMATVRHRLAATLPDYLMPSELVSVDALPLLPTGKVDRRALSSAGAPVRVTAPAPRPQDLVELRLTRAWERVLGVRPIHPTDDFFAVGGHSLAAAHLFSEIQAAFGVNLPLVTLMEAPTIEALAALVRREARPQEWSPIVPLQTDGAGPPVYYVPGAGSDVLSAWELARCLAPEHPVYGMQPLGVDGSRQCHRSVEEMAAYYVRHLRAQPRREPYFLIGGSFGGVVALEMARQLAAAGSEVAFLAVIDSHIGDFPRKAAHPTLRQRAEHVLRWWLPFASKEEHTWGNLRRGIRERWDRIVANLDMMLPLRSAPPPHIKRFLYLQEVSFRARARYVPRPYPGRIVLLRTAVQPPAWLFEPDPELGWHGLAQGGLEIHDVPGTHNDPLREPYVQVTARTLKEAMRRAQAAVGEASAAEGAAS
jgi:amino acid adenylation domain-containing protein